jgi:hypothetical protein
MGERLRGRSFEQKSKVHFDLEGACHSSYMGESWVRRNIIFFLNNIEIVGWNTVCYCVASDITFVPQSQLKAQYTALYT